MTLASTNTTVMLPAAPEKCPDGLVRAVRAEVGLALGWQKTADRVACALRANLPDAAELLPARLRQGDPSCYQSHLLYCEPDGSFSISAMVWLPGQETIIHDHVAWCVTGVLQGREYEEIFEEKLAPSTKYGIQPQPRRNCSSSSGSIRASTVGLLIL